MLVFIDESGDTGLKIKKGATKYFGIFMVVFEDNDEALACDQRIDLLRRELRLSADFEFHFYKNSNRVRENFLKAVLPYQFFCYGIVINKEKLENAIVTVDESGRKLFKYQLASYLKRKLNVKNNYKHIKKVKMQNSKGNNLLQLADMVAGAINRSFNKKKDNYRFRSIIKPREIYVQIWPK